MQAATANMTRLDELARLKLERNALELEANGYTVVEDALDPDLTARGLEAALSSIDERNGKRPNIESDDRLRRLLGVAIHAPQGSGVSKRS